MNKKTKIQKTEINPSKPLSKNIEKGNLTKEFPINFIYNGRKIFINKDGKNYKVTIDNELIPLEQLGKKELIAIEHAPFTSHKNIVELAMYVVDNIINLRCDFPTLKILTNQQFNH